MERVYALVQTDTQQILECDWMSDECAEKENASLICSDSWMLWLPYEEVM